ncbi:MAG TPA: DUF4118 domain-containing protein [Acidimicrobiia bacterium]|nr:DUF4118 domain-containing protein [Acidimicrobiia bacterium]
MNARTTLQHRPPDLGDPNLAFGVLIGVAGSGAVALLMLPFRDEFANADFALGFVIPVLIAAIVGGRVAGVVSAVVAALTFNFLFTQPYLSLRINDRDDIVTFVVLFLVALIAAEAGVRSRRGQHAARRSQSELERLRRILDLAVNEAPAAELIDTARTELVGLLELERCDYESDAHGGLPLLTRRGALEGTPLVVWGEAVLPTGGVEVPVRARGRDFGRFVLYARPETQASLEQRVVAVALADELSLTLSAS